MANQIKIHKLNENRRELFEKKVMESFSAEILLLSSVFITLLGQKNGGHHPLKEEQNVLRVDSVQLLCSSSAKEADPQRHKISLFLL